MNTLDAKQFSDVKELFLSAIREQPQKRISLIVKNCGANLLIQEEVDRLLKRRQQARKFLRKSTVPRPASFKGTARFEVRRTLGSGGFGEVYQVFDRHLQADVALKVLRQ